MTKLSLTHDVQGVSENCGYPCYFNVEHDDDPADLGVLGVQTNSFGLIWWYLWANHLLVDEIPVFDQIGCKR